jgi:Domain of unknown function (DUF4333)
MLAGMSRRALIPAALLALLVAGCSQTIDSDKAETTIARLVETRIGTKVKRVECPSGKTAKKGDAFACRVIGRDGSTGTATVIETDDKGGVRVAAQLLHTGEAERSMAAALTHRRGKPVGVDCQDIIVARKNVVFECATSSATTRGRLTVRQIDDQGRLRYRLVKER